MRGFGVVRGFALSVVVVIGLVGCAGSAAANDPVGTVTAAMNAVNSGGLAKLADFACAAHKNDIANAFSGGNLSGLEAAGIKPEELLNAMSVKFDNLQATEVSRSDATAKVHVTGTMNMSFDKDKFKGLMKTILAAQGQPADDATIGMMVDGMSAQLSKSQPFDEDVDVVNEGGKWLVCDNG